MTEKAVRLGRDAVAAQVQLSAQISGPLAEQLRQHSEAAGALANRLQEDLRASEEAAIQRRLAALRAEVSFVSTREREAQELYRRTKEELDELTAVNGRANGYH